MSSNVIHVNFSTKKSSKARTNSKEKKQGILSLIKKALDPHNEEKSIFLRSMAFRFWI